MERAAPRPLARESERGGKEDSRARSEEVLRGSRALRRTDERAEPSREANRSLAFSRPITAQTARDSSARTPPAAGTGTRDLRSKPPNTFRDRVYVYLVQL